MGKVKLAPNELNRGERFYGEKAFTGLFVFSVLKALANTPQFLAKVSRTRDGYSCTRLTSYHALQGA